MNLIQKFEQNPRIWRKIHKTALFLVFIIENSPFNSLNYTLMCLTLLIIINSD